MQYAFHEWHRTATHSSIIMPLKTNCIICVYECRLKKFVVTFLTFLQALGKKFTSLFYCQLNALFQQLLVDSTALCGLLRLPSLIEVYDSGQC